MNNKLQTIVIIDYQGGNLASAERAVSYVCNQMALPSQIIITNQPDIILNADRLILPGQGAFKDCMEGLKNISGLYNALNSAVYKGTPFLGICVGMQLMAQWGFEHETTQGLGWIKGEINKIKTHHLPLPQMGWNELHFKRNHHPILENIPPNSHAYFVHSYALTKEDQQDVLATTDYDMIIPAIIAKDNKIGTQFHVEKSQKIGLQLIANFLRWQPNISLTSN